MIMVPAPAARPPLFGLLITLSLVTGLVDAVSVLGLGKVFTANMTGNIVFLGFATAGTPGFRAAPYLAALVAFMVGATAAGRLARRLDSRPLRGRLLPAALAEASLLWGAGGVALGFDIETQTPAPALYAIIALTAVAMGLRNATIRGLKVPDLTTTVLTLTLTGLAADSRIAGGDGAAGLRRLGGVFAIFLGAALGAGLVAWTGLAPPLALAGVLTLGGALACALHPAARIAPAG